MSHDERQLVSPSAAVLAKLSEETDGRGNPCSVCQRWPARSFEFQSVRGLFVLEESFSDREVVAWWVCRNCAIKVGLKAQGANLLLGWWSPFSFFWNLYALACNSMELFRSFSLGRPSASGERGA